MKLKKRRKKKKKTTFVLEVIYAFGLLFCCDLNNANKT